MADGVPIKVVIGLKSNGQADYPDWTTLPLASGGATPEDKEALVAAEQIVKWVYDKTSGHQEDTTESPAGQQLGMMVVTSLFSTQALAAFPTVVSTMTEAEAQDFWENKAHAHLPTEKIDIDALTGLKAQRDLLVAVKAHPSKITELDARIFDALNPDHEELGVRKNKDKSWTDAKANRGFGIL